MVPISGQRTVTTAGSAEALGSMQINGPLMVKALPGNAGSIAVGSKANRLAPGLALHAELRALQAAGLSGEQALHAAGKNGALLLGAENQVGAIVPGALADLVLVSGDPLEDVSDALNIVAVVRNGRFFSAVSLLERAADAVNVE